jgi:CRISPR-associated protein Cas2
MQRLILIYDIVEDKPRTKIADACLDYGLDRIQYSVFAGKLSRNLQEELMLRIDELLMETAGKIMLIPISEDDWRKVLELEYA